MDLSYASLEPQTPTRAVASPQNHPTLVPQDLRTKLQEHQRDSKKVAKQLLDVQQRIPQVTRPLYPAADLAAGLATGHLPTYAGSLGATARQMVLARDHC